MSEIVKRAADTAHAFDLRVQREFGSTIQVPELQAVHHELVAPQEDLVTVTHPGVPGADVVPIGQNFKALTGMIGRGFGLFMLEQGKPVIYPGVITNRTTDEALHVTYLRDSINPRCITVTPLQRYMLRGGYAMQDIRVGTQASHTSSVSIAAELGHATMALRSLTDLATGQAIKDGQHVVHGWSESARGLAPNLTERDTSKPGAFDLQTRDGTRWLTFGTVAITPASPYALVQSDAFELDAAGEDAAVAASKVVVGVGIVAARQLHGSNTDTMLMQSMGSI